MTFDPAGAPGVGMISLTFMGATSRRRRRRRRACGAATVYLTGMVTDRDIALRGAGAQPGALRPREYLELVARDGHASTLGCRGAGW